MEAQRKRVRVLLGAMALLAAAPGVASDSPAELVMQIQRADYEGDRAALKRLFRQLGEFSGHPQFGAKVRYWRGFALWRRALKPRRSFH